MKLYKIVGKNDEGTKTVWTGSMADAGSTRASMVSNDGFTRKEIETYTVDVPTDKTGLLNWLNATTSDAEKHAATAVSAKIK